MDYSPWVKRETWPFLKVAISSKPERPCPPNLMCMHSLVSEILVFSKMAKFPFRPMDYSPWSSKNLINRNWLKKFRQIGVDVKCMHIKFGGRGLSGFGDIATF